MKILMSEPAGYGGICQYTYNLCNALAQENEVILATSKNYELDSYEKEFRLEKTFHRSLTYPLYYLKFLVLLHRERPDILHLQWLPLPLFDTPLLKLLKRYFKIIITAHDVLPHSVRFYHPHIFREVYKNMDAIIVHSKVNRAEMEGLFGIDSKNLFVVPLGNYMFFEKKSMISKPDAKERIGLSKDDRVVLFFGHILRYKGLEYLLKAFGDVVREVPNARLIIAGEPREDFSPYHRLISEMGIQEHLVMDLEYLPLERVSIYFSAADVVALPYIKTYQSAVLQLAYAFGKPVIVTRTGGLPEVVEDGKSGYVVPTEDPGALAEAVVRILSDEAKLQMMGEYAKRMAETRYSWETIAGMTYSVYRQVLDSRSPLIQP